MAEMTGGIAPQQQPAPADDEVPDEDAANVTPEEQAQYDALVLTCTEMIFEDGKVAPGVLKLLDDDPADLKAVIGDAPEGFTPVIALAATAALVMLEVVEGYEEDDRPADEVIFKAGEELISDLAQVATKYGTHDFTEDEVSQAFIKGADLYQTAARERGLLDPAAAQEDFEEIKAADREGRLGELLPGLEQAPQPQEGGEDGVRR